LIARGANENPKHTGIYGNCITAACAAGELAMVRFWLERGSDPRECTPGIPYWSPIIAACSGSDDDEIVSLLLDKGCNPNIAYPFQNEPADAADIREIVFGDRYSWHCALLLNHMWNHTLTTGPTMKLSHSFMGAPVIAATSGRNNGYILPALAKAGAVVNIEDAQGSYPSAYFAVKDLKKQSAILSWLLDHGASRPSPDGRLNYVRSFAGLNSNDLSNHPTASRHGSFWGNMLSMAVVKHDLTIPYLLSKGAAPEEVIPGSFYGSALIASAALLRGRALKDFVDGGANVNHVATEGEFGNPLIAACTGPVANHNILNTAFYKENNLNYPEQWEQVQFDIIEYLLDEGANPNATHRGLSPLIMLIGSTSNLCYSAVKLMLNRGADPNARLPKWGFKVSSLVPDYSHLISRNTKWRYISV
jgi:hypothetical protein